MQIKDIEKLKVWLFSKLEPLCDADPAALSKYVVALLRKEKPKAALKELCIDQLEVFLAKETVAFVEKLFRCLESESYLKREETPPPSPPKSKPAAEQPQSTAKNVDRRQSEDVRRKEVDDDDRDFRRSKRHESEAGGEQPKRPTAPITVGRGDSNFAGKKRRNEDGGPSSSIKRRMVESRSKPPESSSSTSGSVDASSTSVSTAGATEPSVSVSVAGRRPARERLGPRPPDDRSDGNRSGGRRHHHGHSPSHSWTSSSSENDSGSDSDSSTGSSVSGGKHSRKRRRHVQSKEPKKRQRCKDYDERGFCILGESCPYDHGIDPLVIGGGINPYPLGIPPPPGLPLPPIGKPPGILVPPLLPPVLPPAPRVSPPPTTTTIDGYNPEDPGLSSSSSSRGFVPTPIVPPQPIPLQQTFPPPPSIGGISVPPPPSLMSFPPPRYLTASTTLTASTNFHHQGRPRPPFGGRGPGRPSDTLIIRKIPRELNTITKLSSHFEKFGTVVNLTVRYEGDPEGALIQFSSPTEAKKAHSSTEAVLNNRFIRIYFLRKDHVSAPAPLTEVTLESPASVAISTIHGAPPAPPPAGRDDVIRPASQVVTSNSAREETENHINEISKGPSDVPPHSPAVKASPSPTSLSAPSQPLAPPISRSTAPPQSHAPPPQLSAQQRRKSAEAAKKKLELQKKTSELLQKQIQQQKLLISKLEKSGKHLSSEEKDTIMKSLKTLSGSISKLKEAAAKTVATTSKGMPESAAQKPAPMQQQQVQKQQITDDLKAKADALRKQAHMLGLLSSPSQPLPTAGRDHNQHHDLRSKLSKQRQLLVMNVANRDQLTSYFDSFGGLDGVEVDPSNPNNLIFTFRNKTIANQVVNKGSTLNGKPLIMKWYTPKPGAAVHPTLPTVKSPEHTAVLPHHQTADVNKPTSLDIAPRRVVVEKQPSISDDQLLGPTTPTLTKLDPEELHLVDDSDDEEEEEGRSWRR